jgi:hypothetical protein
MSNSDRTESIAAAAVFAATFAVHAGNLRLALLGWDTYATVLTARVASLRDLAGTFTEKLMDGRLPYGDFYRPVGNAIVAIDTAIWGLRPFGHQLTSLLVFCAATTLLFAVVSQRARDLAPDRIAPRVVAGGAASMLLALHPAVLSVLPVVARRTETLMACFALAALCAAHGGRRRGRVISAAFAALAVGSKEPGIVVLPLLAVDRLCASRREGLRARLIDALEFVSPSIAAVAAFGVVHTIVLRGLGGYFEASDAPYPARLLFYAPAYLGMVFATGPLSGFDHAGVVVAGAVLGVAAGLLAILARAREDRGAGADPGALLALPAIGLSWLAIHFGLACTTASPQPRYAQSLVLGLALVIGGVMAFAVRERSVRLTLVTAFPIACALLGSPLWQPRGAFAEASRLQIAELSEFERTLRGSVGPSIHDVRARRMVDVYDRGIDPAWMLSPWSLQAWAELTFPDRKIRVEENVARLDPVYWNLRVIVE